MSEDKMERYVNPFDGIRENDAYGRTTDDGRLECVMTVAHKAEVINQHIDCSLQSHPLLQVSCWYNPVVKTQFVYSRDITEIIYIYIKLRWIYAERYIFCSIHLITMAASIKLFVAF